MKNKREIGITLVALIVTIIILLILAGITISQLTGSGLFEKVQLAKEKHENATAKETEYLESLSNLSVGASVNGDRDTITMSRTELINLIKEYSNPTGTIIAFSTGTVPDGYLECNGQVVSRTTYSDLFAVIGTTYGAGDGSTTFKVPDLRGEFLRGAGENSHTNQGNGGTVGVHQDSTNFPNIGTTHAGTDTTTGYSIFFRTPLKDAQSDIAFVSNTDKQIDTSTNNIKILFDQDRTNSFSYSSFSAFTIRPTNTSVLYCIKYK